MFWLALYNITTTLERSVSQTLGLFSCLASCYASRSLEFPLSEASIMALLEIMIVFRPAVVETANLGLSHLFQLHALLSTRIYPLLSMKPITHPAFSSKASHFSLN
jgi:hypothetical protein